MQWEWQQEKIEEKKYRTTLLVCTVIECIVWIFWSLLNFWLPSSWFLLVCSFFMPFSRGLAFYKITPPAPFQMLGGLWHLIIKNKKVREKRIDHAEKLNLFSIYMRGMSSWNSFTLSLLIQKCLQKISMPGRAFKTFVSSSEGDRVVKKIIFYACQRWWVLICRKAPRNYSCDFG